MDALAELESMATNALIDQEVTSVDIVRWQTLFGFSACEAQQEIERFRSDLGRTTISDESWSSLASEHTQQGFDKESFEYSLSRKTQMPETDANSRPRGNARGTFIMKLEYPLDHVNLIQSVLNTANPPEILLAHGQDEDSSEGQFCKVSGTERLKLLDHLAHHHPSFRPTFVRLAKAPKDLSTYSCAPFLGLDVECLLPHHRPSSEVVQHPAQDEFPVWYFFYGKLARPDVLRSVLGLEKAPILEPAKVRGGKIKTWGAKYNAMVDATTNDDVDGWAFQIMSQEHEES